MEAKRQSKFEQQATWETKANKIWEARQITLHMASMGRLSWLRKDRYMGQADATALSSSSLPPKKVGKEAHSMKIHLNLSTKAKRLLRDAVIIVGLIILLLIINHGHIPAIGH